RLLTTVVEAQSWEVDAVSEATYTSRGILGAVQNALTGEVVNNPLPPQPKPAAPLMVEEFTAPSTYLDGIYTAEAMGFEGEITVQVTVAEDKITDITLLSAEDEEEYLSMAKQVIPAILEGQSPNVDAVSGATYSSTGILNAVKLALAKAAVAPAEESTPEQAASKEAAEVVAAPSEVPGPDETPVAAPTVEVVQPEEKSAVPAWLKEIWQQLFPADEPASSEPEPASSEEVLSASEAALPPEETETEPETEGAAE
ncbi:MAG: FMN-binding protein, partial [Faecalibacterium prausnitzii]|nr:FMN-binding protein [Faecalibacterium prausnitzii]